MAQSRSFADLMHRLQGGDQDAAAEVFRLYAQRLIALARELLDARSRLLLSGSDVAQEVLNSFFRRQGQTPYDLDNESALWALLAEITLRKCNKWNRHFAARKRVGDRSPAGTDDSLAALNVPDSSPTPEDAAMLADTVAELYRGLKGNERIICELRLQGFQVREIAERINLTEATVSRKLSRLKDKLQRLCIDEE